MIGDQSKINRVNQTQEHILHEIFCVGDIRCSKVAPRPPEQPGPQETIKFFPSLFVPAVLFETAEDGL
jgi:hypothetical protein